MVSRRTVILAAILACLSIGGTSPSAQGPQLSQNPNDLSGSWTLNKELSEFPKELGFSATFLGPELDPSNRRGERRGGGLNRIPVESAEDAQRVTYLTDEVRLPFDHLTIAVTPADVTITPDRTAARIFHPGRRDEPVTLGRVSGVATASWDLGRLVIDYRATSGRTVRYTYAANQSPRQLIVEVEFVEPGGGDRVRRIYEPTRAGGPAATAASSAGAAPSAASPAPPAAPASTAGPPTSAIDQRPDAPLKGLNRLGVVLEALSPDAAKCGLKEEALESAVAKRLTDGGFRVVRNSDDDTYLYVNINTVTASAGLCVSRYDVTLYSHTAAKLTHTAAPVLLQVELLHRGGIAGGGPAAHADGVMKGVLQYVDLFATRVKSANN